jgi:uncharacterized membrane protein YfcA
MTFVEPSLAGLMLLGIATAAGAAIQAATGFGFAILAAPVFLAVLDSPAAMPMLVALHVGQCVVLVPRVWQGVPWSEFMRLGMGAAAGCPIGLALFHTLEVRHLKLASGIVILAVAGLLAFRRRRALGIPARQYPADAGRGGRIAAFSTGALSGALTAVLVMPGPPLMVHLLRHPLPHDSARALSLTFFAACYLAVLTAHLSTGGMNTGAWTTVGWLTAPLLAGTFAGLGLARWIADRHFAAVLNGLLILAGIGAIASAL